MTKAATLTVPMSCRLGLACACWCLNGFVPAPAAAALGPFPGRPPAALNRLPARHPQPLAFRVAGCPALAGACLVLGLGLGLLCPVVRLVLVPGAW